MLLPQIFVDVFIIVLFIELSHICICFGALGAQISDGRHLWVGGGGRSFSHYGWLVAVTVCCSEVSLHFLHRLGKFVGCSWPKVKNVAFRVSAPSLGVNLFFGLQTWFISRFLASVLLGLGGLPGGYFNSDALTKQGHQQPTHMISLFFTLVSISTL